ncbi:MAG: hypothetical protein ACRDL5_01525 [Solirubrobacteraceae bacterium]
MKLLSSITAPITIGDFEAPLDAGAAAELLLLAGAALLELDELELELDPQADTTTIVATAVAAANHRPRMTYLPIAD